ncbi:hypothetical protein D3C78_1644430 [compost metagenome]
MLLALSVFVFIEMNLGIWERLRSIFIMVQTHVRQREISYMILQAMGFPSVSTLSLMSTLQSLIIQRIYVRSLQETRFEIMSYGVWDLIIMAQLALVLAM